MNYKQSIEYLESFIDYEKREKDPVKNPFRLDRVRKLLSALGNPEKDFKSAHAAGTNGKGSTSAMLASILTDSGARCGLYTSPHLISFRERIRVDGAMITEDETARLTGRVKSAVAAIGGEGGRPSFFEVYTALCFCYFSVKKVDFAVIETGLGGRLDATNVIKPVICLITPVGMDHMRELGETLPEIAAEKCGIIKPGAPVICSGQNQEVLSIVKNTASAAPAAFFEVRFQAGRDEKTSSCSLFLVQRKDSNLPGNLLDLTTPGRVLENLYTPMAGKCQALNAAAAAAAGLKLGIDEKFIRSGLEKAVLPGRMQFIEGAPPFLLDGAHNPPAAENLAEHLKFLSRKYTITLIFGASKDKDYGAVAEKIFPLADNILLTRSLNPRAAEPELLMEKLKTPGMKAESMPGLKEAIKNCVGKTPPGGLVCVAGSFFLVGETLELMEKEPGIFVKKPSPVFV